jgi:hypothetical protein
MIVAPLGLLLLAGCEAGRGFILPESGLLEIPSGLVNSPANDGPAVDPVPDVPGTVLSPTPENRVLLDPGNDRAYVANRQNGVDAVRLRDGLRCWSTAAGQRPVALCREGVLCLCGGPTNWSVALLNTSSGNPIWVSEPLGIAGGELFCEARWEQGELICSWRCEAKATGAGRHDGVVRIDFRTGQVLANQNQPQPPGDAGAGPQQPTKAGHRTYSVIEQEQGQRFLETRDSATGKRLWRYPLVGSGG